MTTKSTQDLIADAVQEILNAQVVGVTQTWTDVTASRAYATTYTNTTGKPIQLATHSRLAAGDTAQILIDGVQVMDGISNSGTTCPFNVQLIIPDGSTYRLNETGAPQLVSWWELR